MTARLFESAIGISDPWSVAEVEFDDTAKTLTVPLDFKTGSRIGVSGNECAHLMHDTLPIQISKEANLVW